MSQGRNCAAFEKGFCGHRGASRASTRDLGGGRGEGGMWHYDTPVMVGDGGNDPWWWEMLAFIQREQNTFCVDLK